MLAKPGWRGKSPLTPGPTNHNKDIDIIMMILGEGRT
jgi:hypothetical protein